MIPQLFKRAWAFPAIEQPMAIQLVKDLIKGKSFDGFPIPEMGIHCTEGLELPDWGESMLTWMYKGLMPPTLDQAVGIRYYIDGAHNSAMALRTRTLIGIIGEGPSTWRIIPYEPSTPASLQHAVKMFQSADFGHRHVDIELTDDLAQEIIASSGDRVFTIDNTSAEFNIVPDQEGDFTTCDYARSTAIKSLLPTTAHLNAAYIHRHGDTFHRTGNVYFNIERKIPEGSLRLKLLDLGAGDCQAEFSDIYAGDFHGKNWSFGIQSLPLPL